MSSTSPSASSLTTLVKERLIALIREQFDLALPDLVCEVPPRTALGDLAFPVAFELAKQLKASTGQKRNPRELASALAAALEQTPTGREVHVHVEHLSYIDHACLDLLMNWAKQHESTGGKLVIDWASLQARFHPENGRKNTVVSKATAHSNGTDTDPAISQPDS